MRAGAPGARGPGAGRERPRAQARSPLSADYVLLSGARKNVGDFLIAARGLALLARYRPDRTTELVDRGLPLDDKLADLNAARAVILLGGPAYTRDFWPGVYPLCAELARIEVPVIPLALGWCGEPALQPERFAFDADSLRALRWLHGRIDSGSCRDETTRQILLRHGIGNTVVTGCTVWHDPDCVGREFARPRRVERVVFTPGARRVLALQNAALLLRLRRRFPDAEIHCVFHRGLHADEYTRASEAWLARGLARLARALDCRVTDAAFDVGKIDFYRDCDLHVGYRVHAHLRFLSLRKPSFLLAEDGRGLGAAASLGLDDPYARRRGALARLLARLDAEVASGFAGFAPVAARLDAAHAQMRAFLDALP